ncbi:MAG TPA: C40 family peptidase [Vicinamibacterales bacterium]
MGIRIRLHAAVLGLAILSAACAGRSAVPEPFPTARRPPTGAPPEHAPVMSAPVPPAIADLLQTATALIGTPYRMGGGDPQGFDCSGFVHYVFGQHGVQLPRTVEEQAEAGRRVGRPEAGDLVFFRTEGRGPSHVGIALGPDRFIHAPSSRGRVRIELLGSSYWSSRFLEARRVP